MVFAASFVLLPYYTFNYLISSGGEGSRSPLADKSLHAGGSRLSIWHTLPLDAEALYESIGYFPLVLAGSILFAKRDFYPSHWGNKVTTDPDAGIAFRRLLERLRRVL